MKEDIALKDIAALIKEAKWHRIQVLEKKQHMFFELESKERITLSLAGCFPLVVAPIFLVVAFKVYSYPEIGQVVATVSGGLGLIMLLTGLWVLYSANKSEDGYLLDFDSDELIELKKKRGEVSRKILCSFASIDSIVLYPRYSFKSGESGWYYGVSAITKAGSLFDLVSRKNNRSREKALELGSALAKLLKLAFHHGGENTVFEYKQSPQGLEFSYVHFEPKAQSAV